MTVGRWTRRGWRQCLYPLGGQLEAWAVSFGFKWTAFGLLFAATAVLSPSKPRGPSAVVLAVTWVLCWLPHGVIGVGVALQGTTGDSAARYQAWAAHPLGPIVIAVDAACSRCTSASAFPDLLSKVAPC